LQQDLKKAIQRALEIKFGSESFTLFDQIDKIDDQKKLDALFTDIM